MTISKRDQLIDVAVELFFRNGCHATGIDTLLAEAGVAKMTLYSHFKSKDELILAAVEKVQQEQLQQLESILNDPGLDYEERLHAVFDNLEQAITSPGFIGCPFHNIAAEFRDPEHPVRQLIARHKRKITDRIVSALQRAGASEPRQTALRMMLLVEGAKIMVHLTGDQDYLRQARAAGRDLLVAALKDSAG